MPAGVHTTRTFFKASAMTLMKVYEKSQKEAPEIWPEQFNVVEPDMKRPFYTAMPIVGFGVWGQKPEGQAPQFDEATEGIPFTITFNTFALAYKITEEADLEDTYNLTARLPRMLARGKRTTMEQLFWAIINFGFDSRVVLADGLPLFSTTHPLGGGTVAQYGTYSNALAPVSLVPESWQQAVILMETLSDDRGLPEGRTPVMLTVHPNNHKTAEEVLGSPYYPYSNENRKNIAFDQAKLLVSRYQTNPLQWTATAPKGDLDDATHSMSVLFKWRDRQRTWFDEATGNINHRGSFRAGWGTFDGRGAVSTQGA